MSGTNKQILLAARPVGFPKLSDFQLVETPVPSPGDGEFLVGASYLSVDPYMRGRMSEAKSYAEPVKLGEVMTGGVVGRLLGSRPPNSAESGDGWGVPLTAVCRRK
jgi:NADPH-dependent curcumin reductase CurA